MTKSALRILFGSAALGLAGSAAAQVSGAIFTTTPDGAIVNENVHYAAKADVFLSGGPGPNAPPGAAGLPPGEYYFMVTDPSGKQLLSTDTARERCVVIGSGGYMVNQACGSAFGPGTHLQNAKAGGAAQESIVQLIPFDDTPNNGGVYKAWMTPVEAYVGNIDVTGNQNCGNGCFHGFVPADSKTDNFKVRDVATYCITAWKFIDDKKKGQTGVASGWPILFGGNVYHTSADGFVRICELTAGTYPIAEQLPDDYEVVATEINGDPVEPPTTSVTVTVGKGQRGERDAIVVWTNRNVFDDGCTKDCYYK
jgi:hypothetical protein